MRLLLFILILSSMISPAPCRAGILPRCSVFMNFVSDIPGGFRKIRNGIPLWTEESHAPLDGTDLRLWRASQDNNGKETAIFTVFDHQGAVLFESELVVGGEAEVNLEPQWHEFGRRIRMGKIKASDVARVVKRHLHPYRSQVPGGVPDKFSPNDTLNFKGVIEFLTAEVGLKKFVLENQLLFSLDWSPAQRGFAGVSKYSYKASLR